MRWLCDSFGKFVLTCPLGDGDHDDCKRENLWGMIFCGLMNECIKQGNKLIYFADSFLALKGNHFPLSCHCFSGLQCSPSLSSQHISFINFHHLLMPLARSAVNFSPFSLIFSWAVKHCSSMAGETVQLPRWSSSHGWASFIFPSQQ